MFKYVSKFRDTKKRDGVCRFFKLSKGSCGYIIACLALIVAYSVSTGVGQMTFARSYGKNRYTNRSFNNRSFNNGAINNRSFNNRSFNNRSFNNKSFNNKSFNNRSFNNRSFNNKSFNNRSFNNKSFNSRPINNRTLLKATEIAKLSHPAFKINGKTEKPAKLRKPEKRQLRKLFKEFWNSVDNLDKNRRMPPRKKSNEEFLFNTEKFMKKRINAHSVERHGAHLPIDSLIERSKKDNLPRVSKFLDSKSHMGAFLIARQIGKLNADKGEWSTTISTGRFVGLMYDRDKGKTYPVRNIRIVGCGQNIKTIIPTDDEHR